MLAGLLPGLAVGQTLKPQTINLSSPAGEELSLNIPYRLAAETGSGLPLAFAVAGPARIQNNTLTATNYGTVLLTVSQGGDQTYAATNLVKRFNLAKVDFEEIGSYTNHIVPRNGQLVGNRFYVVDLYLGLQILDVSDPTHPIRLGGFDGAETMARGVRVVGNLAYVASGPDGLKIIDVSDPTAPFVVGTFDTPGIVNAVDVAGNVAVLADGSEGVRFLDVSSPAKPAELSRFRPGGGLDYYSLQIVGHFAYAVATGIGISVIDFSDPTHPTPVGSTIVTGGTYLDIVGDFAYVTGISGGFGVVRVSDPAHPVVVGKEPGKGEMFGLKVAGNLAFAASLGGGVFAIDITDPAHPVTVGQQALSGVSYTTHVAGDLVYVLDAWSKVRVFRYKVGLKLDDTRFKIERFGEEVGVSWPTNMATMGLWQADSLTAPTKWEPVSIQPKIENGKYRTRLPLAAAGGFYQLSGPKP